MFLIKALSSYKQYILIIIRVLFFTPSKNFFIEVDGLLDPEECDLLIAIAQGKGMKLLRQQISPLKMRNAEKLLRDWDYDQDGFISQNEVSDTENR